jgi:hypothetical protein
MSKVKHFHWTGDNSEELRTFAGEAITFGEAGTPVIESMGEHGYMQPDDLISCDYDGYISLMGPLAELRTLGTENWQSSLEKHWDKAERESADPSDWAVPHKQKLRIDDAKHVKLAWDMVTRVKDLSDEERASARKRILAKAKKLGVETSGWTKESISQEDIDAEGAAMEANSSVVKLPDGSGVFVDTVKTPSKEDIGDSQQTPAAVDVFSYLLTHVAEEASELVWAACKVQRYGFDSTCPTTGGTNRDKMRQELSELMACLDILNEELVGAGMEPVIASDDLVQESKQKRLATLQMEYGLGRFYTGSEG